MSESQTHRGRSKSTLELLEACQQITEAAQPITVRGVCYRLFVAGLIDSMAVSNTQKISRLLKWAREEGQIPWEWIVDESRKIERQPHWSDLTGYAKAIEQSYRRDFWAHQGNRVIVISEKATVAGILRPVLEEFGVPFLLVHGFNSATQVHDMASEVANDRRTTVILYAGDYDPSGLFMSMVDLPQRLRNYGSGRFHFKRIALIKSDLPSLPEFPAKKTDPRFRWYAKHYGQRAWELDALNPNRLRDRVKREVEKYVDAGDWQQHKCIEAAQRETTKRIASAMAQASAN